MEGIGEAAGAPGIAGAVGIAGIAGALGALGIAVGASGLGGVGGIVCATVTGCAVASVTVAQATAANAIAAATCVIVGLRMGCPFSGQSSAAAFAACPARPRFLPRLPPTAAWESRARSTISGLVLSSG